MKPIYKFLDLSIVGKLLFCFFIFCTFAAIREAAWVGAAVSAFVAFLIIFFGGHSQSSDSIPSMSQNDIDESYRIQNENEDAYYAMKAEDDRLAEEARVIQEGLDRLH